jgi:hypothetical protein
MDWVDQISAIAMARAAVHDDSDNIDDEEDEEGSAVVNESDYDAKQQVQTPEEPSESEEDAPVVTPAKRKSISKASSSNKKPKKSAKKSKAASSDEESDASDAENPKYGVQKVKPKKSAPKDAVAKGSIGPKTLEFLKKLTMEKYQDRDWFAENDAWYRQVGPIRRSVSFHLILRHSAGSSGTIGSMPVRSIDKAFRSFLKIYLVQPFMQKADDSLPILPSRDLVHRIYRDVRFSTNKNPYKTNLAASFSRAGRKGPFAGYYLHIAANGRSLLAGGRWGMDKNELATVRHSIQTSPKRLRRVIEAPAFVKMLWVPLQTSEGVFLKLP